jgi:hypothetical protein
MYIIYYTKYNIYIIVNNKIKKASFVVVATYYGGGGGGVGCRSDVGAGGDVAKGRGTVSGDPNDGKPSFGPVLTVTALHIEYFISYKLYIVVSISITRKK